MQNNKKINYRIIILSILLILFIIIDIFTIQFIALGIHQTNKDTNAISEFISIHGEDVDPDAMTFAVMFLAAVCRDAIYFVPSIVCLMITLIIGLELSLSWRDTNQR